MKSDFEKWIEYHGDAYPGFVRWVRDNPGHIRFMKNELGEFSIERLAKATDELYGSATQPQGYGSHARAIKQLCIDTTTTSYREEGPRVVDDQYVAECTICMDYGLVEVFTHFDKWPRTAMVACTCPRGDEKVQIFSSTKKGIRRYTPSIDQEWTWDESPHEPQELTGDVLP